MCGEFNPTFTDGNKVKLGEPGAALSNFRPLDIGPPSFWTLFAADAKPESQRRPGNSYIRFVQIAA